MVKLTGPGLSAAASGTLGDILTFGRSRRTPTLRKKPRPKQPRSGLQVSMRAMMTFITQQWAGLTAPQQASWADAYPDPQLSAYNAYIKHNLERWRRRKGPSKAFPATEENAAGFLSNISATGAVRHVDLAAWLTLALNDNWTHFLFHSTVAEPDPDVANLVHVFLQDQMAARYWTHTPLAAGTHHYKICPGTDDGRDFFHVEAHTSAIVT